MNVMEQPPVTLRQAQGLVVAQDGLIDWDEDDEVADHVS